jgi:hypothetical protein
MTRRCMPAVPGGVALGAVLTAVLLGAAAVRPVSAAAVRFASEAAPTAGCTVPAPAARETAPAPAARETAPAPAARETVPPPGRLAVELRGGAAIGEVAAAASGPQWRPGAAWRVGAAYAVLDMVGVYAGYGSNAFGCADGFCQGRDVTFTSRGADAGVELRRQWAWLRGGVVRHELRSQWQSPTGPQAEAAPAAVGWQLGAGATLPLKGLAPFGAAVELAPGVRYSAHGGAAAWAGDGNAGVGFITADVGVRISPRSRSGAQ